MWACSLVCMQHRGWVLSFYFFLYYIFVMMLEMGIFICLFKKKKKPNQFVIVFFGMQIAGFSRWGVVLRFPPEAAFLLNSFKEWFTIKWGIFIIVMN